MNTFEVVTPPEDRAVLARPPGWAAPSESANDLVVWHPGWAAAAVVGGCVLLSARSLLVEATPWPAATLVAVFVVIGAVGTAWPVCRATGTRPERDSTGDRSWSRGTATVGTLAVLGLGVAAFGLGRVLGGGHAPNLATWPLVAASALAAVAEEALFRRLCFALLAPAGAGWAVVGSALLFAVVHVTTYGPWVLPLDLAAGLVFGWQRWASGSWGVPAVTHVLVNLLVVI